MSEIDIVIELGDILLPGDKNKGWPPASAVLTASSWKSNVSKPEILTSFAQQVAASNSESRKQTIIHFQKQNPELFCSFMSALTDLYYNSPIVYELVTAIVKKGPSEPKPFDNKRLNRVRRLRSPKR